MYCDIQPRRRIVDRVDGYFEKVAGRCEGLGNIHRDLMTELMYKFTYNTIAKCRRPEGYRYIQKIAKASKAPREWGYARAISLTRKCEEVADNKEKQKIDAQMLQGTPRGCLIQTGRKTEIPSRLFPQR